MICVAIVLTTLAYGTVHYWALAVFVISAAGLIAFWAVDAAVLRSALLPVNPLQWPVLGVVVLGLLQLLPLRTHNDGGLSLSPVRSLSLDPYATRLVIMQISALLIYFVMTTMFLDTPRRLKALVRTIVIFGFIVAAFGLTQSFTTDGTRVYWFRQLTQSTAFGPFINRPSFCRLHGTRAGDSARPALEWRARKLQAAALRVRVGRDGNVYGGHQFARRNYQFGAKFSLCWSFLWLQLAASIEINRGRNASVARYCAAAARWGSCGADWGCGSC
jgi:hypothetical protein